MFMTWTGIIELFKLLPLSTKFHALHRLRLHWKLPELPSVLTSISFHPDSPTSLVCVLANNTFLIFDVEVMAMSPWSIAHTDKIPAAVRGGSCPLEGLVFRSMTPGKEAMFLYGQGSIVYVDVNKAIPQVLVFCVPPCIPCPTDQILLLVSFSRYQNLLVRLQRWHRLDFLRRRSVEGAALRPAPNGENALSRAVIPISQLLKCIEALFLQAVTAASNW